LGFYAGVIVVGHRMLSVSGAVGMTRDGHYAGHLTGFSWKWGALCHC